MFSIILMILSLTTSLVEIINGNRSFPKVCIPEMGCMEGTVMPGYRIKSFEGFLGIPYAQPPIGDLRLANPLPAKPWEGTLKANVPKMDCIQRNYLLPIIQTTGVEDCLYLNVYRPLPSNRTRLPVMVYFHGGGFFAGSPNPLITGPEYFMDTREVILVIVGYRLGALGFLSTGDDVISGNFGLKDQSMALKWVQKYIRFFGGDSNSVTIFGQSAGGASVHMHMFSPLSEGLFHKVIILSGNSIAPYNTPVDDPLSQARKQAELCGIKNSNQLSNKELLHALRQIDAKTFVNAGDGFKYWQVDPLVVFRPTIERNRTKSFLIGDPQTYMKNGNFRHVPWMVGFVPFEGAVRALSIISNDTIREDFNKNFDFLLEKLMEFPKKSQNNIEDKMKKLIDFYLNGIHKLTPENSQRLGDMITDRAFLHPMYHSIKDYVKYADVQKNPIYLHKFAFEGPFSYSQLFSGTDKKYGVVHCDDLLYLFKSPALIPSGFDVTSTEAKVISVLVDTFVSFAKLGKPKIWSKMSPCNNHSFYTGNNQFCDYQEFKNAPNSLEKFKIETKNYIDMNVIRLWDDLLESD